MPASNIFCWDTCLIYSVSASNGRPRYKFTCPHTFDYTSESETNLILSHGVAPPYDALQGILLPTPSVLNDQQSNEIKR